MELRVCANCQLAIAPGAARAQGCPHEACEPTIRVKPLRWLIGQRFGNHEIEAVLASGGMGAVFRARHTGLGHAVALKLMQPEIDCSRQTERFRREAKLLAELNHPHIVALNDYDVSPFGVPYFVMELVEGESLSAFIRKFPRGAPRESWLPIARAVGSALAFAHRKGVIHRDLKPDNVMLGLDPPDTLKLLDFGIGKVMPGHTGLTATPTLSDTGFMLGTPLYAAPEQLSGDPTSEKTDQYALALLIAEMINGKPMRDGAKSTLDLLRESVRVPQLTHSLNADPRTVACLERGLAPRPEDRFESVDAFLNALDANEMPAPIQATRRMPTQTPARSVSALSRGLMVLGGLALFAAMIWYGLRGSQPLLHPLAPETTLRPFADGFVLPVPAESQTVLGHDPESGSAILAVPGGWILRALDPAQASQPPARFSLAGDAPVHYLSSLFSISGNIRPALLASTPAGLLSSTLDGQEQTQRSAALGTRSIQIDERARWLLAQHPDRLEVRSAPDFSVISLTLPVDANTDVKLRGGRLFVKPHDGALSIRTLDHPEQAPIGLALPFSRLTDAAAVDDLALVALLLDELNLVLVDTAERREVARFKLASAALGVQLIADRPTVLIIGRFGLQTWFPSLSGPKRASGLNLEAERYSDAKLVLNDNLLGLLALDRVRNRLLSIDYGDLPVSSLGPEVHQHWSRTFTDTENSRIYRTYADGTLESVAGNEVNQVAAHSGDPSMLVFDQDQVVTASADPQLKRFSSALKPLGNVSLGARRAVALSRRGSILYLLNDSGELEQRQWPSLEPGAGPTLAPSTGASEPFSMALNGDASRLALRMRDGRVCVQALLEGERQCMRPDSSAIGRFTELSGSRFALLRQVESKRLLLLDFSDGAWFELPLYGYVSRNIEAIDADSFYLGALGALLRYDFSRSAGGLAVNIYADLRTDLFYDAVAWLPAHQQIQTGWRQSSGFRMARIDASKLRKTPLQSVLLQPATFPNP